VHPCFKSFFGKKTSTRRKLERVFGDGRETVFFSFHPGWQKNEDQTDL